MKEEFYYKQCVLYRSDLDKLGYNNESVSDETMEYICKALNDSMCSLYNEHWSMYYGDNSMECLWWSELAIICGIFEVERKV